MMLAAGAPRAVGREQRCTQPARSRSRSRALPATCHAHKASSSQPSALSMRGGVAGALAALLQGREQSSSGSAAPPPDVDNGELPSKRVLRVRSLFLSDIHLGTAGCQAEPLLELLRSVQCDTMYLVGDVVDGWELSSSRVFWPQTHSDVVQKLLRKARRGTRIFYLPGNHDEAVRDFLQDTVIELGNNIIIQQEAVHFTADGRRFLVLHGDRCDLTPHIRTNLNYQLKSLIYRAFQAFNRVIKTARRVAGLPYWSLASTVNTSVGAAAKLIANYEQALAAEARYQKMSGVICGHIHHAQLREIEGVTYANTGDWVDSCSALVEHFDGRLEVIRWLDVRDQYIGSGKQHREPKSAALDFLDDEEMAAASR